MGLLKLYLSLIPSKVKVKVKCTLVQALRLYTGRTAHRGSRGIALLFHGHGTRRGWRVSVTPRPLFTPGKDPVPIVQEAGWDPGPVWTCAENLVPTGIRSRAAQPVASRYTDWATRPSKGKRIFSFGLHAAFCPTDSRALFLVVTLLGNGNDNSPQSTTEVRNARSYIHIKCLNCAVFG
jgi:hypothetical protein